MRKVVAAVAVVVGIVVTPSAAFAGEITGNGKPTPINGFNANSICSFSGQNDDPTGAGDPFEAGHVQNWGHTKNVAKDLLGDGHGASAITARPPGAALSGRAVVAGLEQFPWSGDDPDRRRPATGP